jgi:hypothetical protein
MKIIAQPCRHLVRLPEKEREERLADMRPGAASAPNQRQHDTGGVR